MEETGSLTTFIHSINIHSTDTVLDNRDTKIETWRDFSQGFNNMLSTVINLNLGKIWIYSIDFYVLKSVWHVNSQAYVCTLHLVYFWLVWEPKSPL